MGLAADTKTMASYSPTSTPILDVLRPLPGGSRWKLSTNEICFLSSALIFFLVALPWINPAFSATSQETDWWPRFFTAVAGALASAIVVHELGHLVAGLLGGFHFAGETLRGNHALSIGGMALRADRNSHLRRRLFLLSAGGPVANLLWAVLLEASPFWAGQDYRVRWLVHGFSACSALMAVAALLPDVSRNGNFSDGAHLLMLLKNDGRAVRLISIFQMQLALAGGKDARDWDPAWITQATANNDDSRDSVTANWLAYLWAAERQDIASATRYLEDALVAPACSAARLRDRLYLEAAIFQAWFRENPAKARVWSQRIRREKLSRSQQQRLSIALLWAEAQPFDAWEGLAQYLSLLQEMPVSPARNLAEKSAAEWKRQMESRMLTRAWRTVYSMSQEVEAATASDESRKMPC